MGGIPVADTPKELPDEIMGFLPKEARWLRSDQFDQSVSQGRYTASFHVDVASRTVIMDCVNPSVQTQSAKVSDFVGDGDKGTAVQDW